MTHLNAYFGAVDEAEAEVKSAQGKLDAAKVALEAKKQEVGFEEETPPKAEPEVSEETAPEKPKVKSAKKVKKTKK